MITMNAKPTTYVAVGLSTIEVPASSDNAHPDDIFIVGIGLFIAQRVGVSRWRFKRYAYAIGAGEPEEALLEWAADRLPGDATLIGYHVDQVLIPHLLNAATGSSPEVAHLLIAGLHRLLKRGAVDVSIGHGGAAAPPLAEIAADMAIYAPRHQPHAVLAGWAIGKVESHRQDIEDEALALWRVFTRDAGLAGIEAEAETDLWLRRSGQRRLVNRAGRAAR